MVDTFGIHWLTYTLFIHSTQYQNIYLTIVACVSSNLLSTSSRRVNRSLSMIWTLLSVILYSSEVCFRWYHCLFGFSNILIRRNIIFIIQRYDIAYKYFAIHFEYYWLNHHNLEHVKRGKITREGKMDQRKENNTSYPT